MILVHIYREPHGEPPRLLWPFWNSGTVETINRTVWVNKYPQVPKLTCSKLLKSGSYYCHLPLPARSALAGPCPLTGPCIYISLGTQGTEVLLQQGVAQGQTNLLMASRYYWVQTVSISRAFCTCCPQWVALQNLQSIEMLDTCGKAQVTPPS